MLMSIDQVDALVIDLIETIDDMQFLNDKFKAISESEETLAYFSDIMLGAIAIAYKGLKLSNLKRLNQLKVEEIFVGIYMRAMKECGLEITVLPECEFLAKEYLQRKPIRGKFIEVALAWLVEWLGIVMKVPGYHEVAAEYIRFCMNNNIDTPQLVSK